MAIEVANRQRLVRLNPRLLGRVAGAALEALDRGGCSATVALVRDRAIKELNRTYRGKDRATDVLSFSFGRGGASERAGGTEGESYLGDIVISADTALAQAERAGHSLDREVSELIIHGILHLCGYDHGADRGEMNRLELKLRRKLLDKR